MPYKIRNARYNHASTIDLELFTEEFGWLPFTASPNDIEQVGQEVYEQAKKGQVAAYVPPSSEELRAALPRLTRRQFKLGLLEHGITSDQILATINAMPDGMEKEVAKIEWEDATTFERGHPLVSSIGSSLGLTEQQIDTMWAAAAAL